MFFSILVPDLHVVAHSQWEGHGVSTKCKLRIITTKEAGVEVLRQLPKEEAMELALHIVDLKENGPDGLVVVEGLAAATFSNQIATYYNNVVSYRHEPARQEILGFMAPPSEGVPSEGIVMWSDMDVNYHVAILYSHEQAERLISTFDWLPQEKQADMLSRSKEWHVQQTSANPEQRLSGIAAKLLGRACVASKIIPMM